MFALKEKEKVPCVFRYHLSKLFWIAQRVIMAAHVTSFN